MVDILFSLALVLAYCRPPPGILTQKSFFIHYFWEWQLGWPVSKPGLSSSTGYLAPYMLIVCLVPQETRDNESWSLWVTKLMGKKSE